MRQYSLAESERMNRVMALAGVFPRVGPAQLDSALRATFVGPAASFDFATSAQSASTIERESARRIAQIVTAVMFALWIADLSLSTNEVVKVVFQMVGGMSLVVPSINVPRLAGLVFDFLWPADEDD